MGGESWWQKILCGGWEWSRKPNIRDVTLTGVQRNQLGLTDCSSTLLYNPGNLGSRSSLSRALAYSIPRRRDV